MTELSNTLINCNRKRVFVDMDGVLCEYRTGSTPEDYRIKGYFISLEPRQKTVNTVKALSESHKYDIYVLSSVTDECRMQSIEEKNKWLDKYLPEIDRNHRIYSACGKSKSDYVGTVGQTDILLDDHSPNLESWVSAGGKAIKVLNECNGKRGTFRGPRINADNCEILMKILN